MWRQYGKGEMGMLSRHLHRILGSLLLLLPMALTPGDVITLDDGSVLEGVIVSQAGAAIIDLRVRAGGVEAIQHIDRHHVVRIEIGSSPHQLLLVSLAEQAQALGEQGSAEAWLSLARQTMAAGEHALGRSYALQAVFHDRHLLEARTLLGEVLQNDVWMLPREAAVARGEVFYDGQWMSWPARARLLASARQAALDANQQRVKLLQAQRDQRLSQELELAEYGTASQDPFNATYAGSSTDCSYASGSVYYDSGYGPYLPFVGGGWNGRHYGHGFHSGIDVVFSGQSRSSSWALNLHW
jgi:hypothetical protein